MSEREENKKKFDPYTGEMLEENVENMEKNVSDRGEDWKGEEDKGEEWRKDEGRDEENREGGKEKEGFQSGENENMAQDEEPTYEKFVWEPMREETQQGDRNDTVQRLPVVQGNTSKGRSDGLETACLILGILSLLAAVSCCFTIFSIPLAIAAIVCGALAGKPEDSRNKKRFVGFLMSIISIVVTVLMVIFLIFVAISTEDQFYDEFHHEFFDEDYDDNDIDMDDFFDGGQEVKGDFLKGEQI